MSDFILKGIRHIGQIVSNDAYHVVDALASLDIFERHFGFIHFKKDIV